VVKLIKIRLVGHVACIKTCKILVRSPQGNKLFGTPRCKWAVEKTMDLRDGCEGVD
jgi:hypothetical protein